ncbi:MAG: hypothetical protein ACRD8U_09250, partial [Pyrinomonadaceae bacterium]
LFSGTALMIFLYYLTGALVLKLPPDVIARVPFEIDPVVRIAWLVGLIPAMSGLGQIIAGLAIRPRKIASTRETPEVGERPPQTIEGGRETGRGVYEPPNSVTERTTNILDRANVLQHVSGQSRRESEK